MLSGIGDRVYAVAAPFAVLAVGGSLSDVGIVAAAATVPFLLFTLAGGVIADRLPRQRIMLASDVVRGVVQAVLAVLLLSGSARVWHLVAGAIVYGTADAFFSPAITGLVPLTVAPERIQEAAALRGMQMAATLVAGPAIAGVVLALGRPGTAFAVDAATFAIGALFLARLRPRAVVREGDGGTTFVAELREGLAEVRARRWVQGFLAAMVVYHVIVLPSIFVLGPVLVDREYGGAPDWAIVTAAFGIGSILGNVVAARHRPARPLVVAALALVVASTQAAIIGSGLSIGVIAALEAVTGVGVSLFFTLWEATLQEVIPERAISRVSSYDYLSSAGAMPIGLAVAGPVAEAIGLHTTLFAMTALAVPAAVALACAPSVRGLRRAAPA